MNLNEAFDISPAKLAALLARIAALGIDPAAIEEQFVKGGGPGGSKINKTANCVVLRYEPLGSWSGASATGGGPSTASWR
jgi:protein subunit release factor B